MTLTFRASAVHFLDLRFFYKYPKDQELCMVSALDKYLKHTKTWSTNGDKFQFLLNYIMSHVEFHSSTISR